MIGICLDCFVEKGLTVTTTTDLCNANNLQNGGIYYYFDTRRRMVLACVEEAISRIEQGAFIALEDIKDVANMMNHLGTLWWMNYLRLCVFWSAYVSQEYGNKVKPYLLYSLQVATPYYTKNCRDSQLHRSGGGTVCPPVYSGAEQLYDFLMSGRCSCRR